MIINLNIGFKIVLFKGYSRRKNYQEILASCNQTHIKSKVNLVAIGVETRDKWYVFFIETIH